MVVYFELCTYSACVLIVYCFCHIHYVRRLMCLLIVRGFKAPRKASAGGPKGLVVVISVT